MPAKFVKVGEPAHDSERQALRYLVDGLPDDYTVYGNPWIVERSGAIYELDAVVFGPRAIFVVEIKGYRGRVDGTDHDWYTPDLIPSPLKLNRKTAQVLRSHLKRAGYEAGLAWVEGYVFLSVTTDCGVRGPASDGRVHTKRSILSALTETAALERLGLRDAATNAAAARALHELLTGRQERRPARVVREFVVESTLAHLDTCTELVARSRLTDQRRVLRVYHAPPLGSDAERQRVHDRAVWEAKVLGRIGGVPGVLRADPPFEDDGQLVLPLEVFEGLTLTTWLERHGPLAAARKARAPVASLEQRVALWLGLAETLHQVHEQGVYHRLLRPDVVLVQDVAAPEHRVTGFELAKQTGIDSTVPLSTLGDDRLVFAAPEVLGAFSQAERASDQFGLGVLLGLLLTGQPLFSDTRSLVARGRLLRRVRDDDPRLPLRLDEAVTRMLELRPPERFPSLPAAIDAVRSALRPVAVPSLELPLARPALDPDALEPGMRVGTDYEILGRLGQGGMGVVYAARHLISGRTRALKIARLDDAAEESLRQEFKVLSELDHPNIVRVLDLSNMIEGRLTLVMERIGGLTLRQRLAEPEPPDPASQRRMAEHLLDALATLEQRGLTHKDLKPDNLLVGDGSLHVIDFSLAGLPADAAYGGTALYRDPASPRWSAATDRYAAALCLFELYAGRHAFDGRVPEPGQVPAIGPEDVDPPALAAFFRRALDPVPERRFGSVRELRAALILALGAEAEPERPTPEPSRVDASTPLRMLELSNRARNGLARSQITTVGGLLALTDEQLAGLPGVGHKTRRELRAVWRRLRSEGLGPGSGPEPTPEPPLMPELVDSAERVETLSLPQALLDALVAARLPTVGAVARLSRTAALGLPGVGIRRLEILLDALHRAVRPDEPEQPRTLDALWDRATRPVVGRALIVLERCFGLRGPCEAQAALAAELGISQPTVSTDLTEALGRLDATVLAPLERDLEGVIDALHGVGRLDVVAARLAEYWPHDAVDPRGAVRVLARRSAGRLQVHDDVEGAEGSLLARTRFGRDALRHFCAEVQRLAASWPPLPPEVARRGLEHRLAGYGRDALDLAVRIGADVQTTDGGALFIAPIDARQSLPYVLERVREPLSFDALEAALRATFGDATPVPDRHHLIELLGGLDCHVQGEQVIPGRLRSLLAPPRLPSDPGAELPTVGAPDPVAPAGAARPPALVQRELLLEAARSRGFRLLVAPPEQHAALGRAAARALGADFLSFDDAFFAQHGDALGRLERAERFAAQRHALSEAADATLSDLLDTHGRPDARLVLGDTGLLGLCDALDLPRRLYDATLSGRLGFWALVLPGVIHRRQPRFNEGPSVWHLEGATLALTEPLPLPEP